MTVYIVDIEPVETRYTAQWKDLLPAQMRKVVDDDVITISGGDTPQTTTPGAFLNFGGTNVYKSTQMIQISEMICAGKIKDGDYFLYTDAWNPTVIQLKYMAELLGLKIRIGGLWHAGSYDPYDFLGRLIGDAPWVRSAEHSMFSCYDDNFFATDFHIDLFAEALDYTGEQLMQANDTVKQVGWPMEYLPSLLTPYATGQKENIVLFPHRIAPEKQPEIFDDLAKSMPQYQFIKAQELNLSKDDYHYLLARSKIVFSANQQETLGISWYEGAIVNTTPLVPNRLSYTEMADGFNDVLYPSEWTESFESYLKHKDLIIERIERIMNMSSADTKTLNANLQKQLEQYFSGSALYSCINMSVTQR